ncbi:RagB/SusD family nutrient uptake outer membrane protein [Parabacteroides hominis]|jgi:hypothetical protein|uniref:RagB/SusD family nutrient uptake outer membrane protein n=1 Tax=Parabacteroides hominis TaxID=2763057 RepID=A0ABR7DJU7_9BACT|nr:RagB/SusD family nutrient uptake outer membrane protein [Parabacteroides hominis]MBC5631710.1 RagB/SusD family nutrient uptake outer membrane protein [Parabacteroides hominis]MBD9165630.1 RagB/SusD family nutrient uptake outer membrane protein [Parabacteroides johnsonii]
MKLKYILCITAFTGALYSCDVTDKSPIDSVTDVTFWHTTNDLKIYANKLYEKLPAPGVDKDNETDNCLTSTYSQFLFNEQTAPATTKDTKWTWENIRACNFFMQRYQTVEGSEAEINLYVAEVRFFRALDYFDKVKAYGDVPWYEKDLQTSDTEELYKARDSRDFVLGKIIEDLEFGVQWLPEKGKEESARLSKDAARTLLARVCLYFGTYKKYHNESGSPTAEELLQKAISVTNDVMATGNYAIVKGTDAGCGQKAFDGYPLYYSNQFVQEDLLSNKECILARVYSEASNVMHETGRQAGSNGTGLTKDFVESFLCKDGNPISVSDKYKGDATLTDEFVDRDPRMYQIIDNTNKPFTVTNGEQTVNDYPNCDGTGAVTGYPCVKFRSPEPAQWEARHTTYDWFVFRYAEVLLINAEAHAELGTCTQDVLDKTINLLRDRVEMPHLTTNPVADPAAIDYGYTVTPLIYEIRRERRIELITEGFRLDDLKRWNGMKVLENPKTMLGIRVTDAVRKLYEGKVNFGGEGGRSLYEYKGNSYLVQYPDMMSSGGRKWTANDRRWFSAIPTDEITLNPNLEQNPGWE